MGSDIKNLKQRLEVSERKRIKLQRILSQDSGEDENLGLWTMLDLMTLLLIFFVMLYSRQVESSIQFDAQDKRVSGAPVERTVIKDETIPLTTMKATQGNRSFKRMKTKIINAMKDSDKSGYYIEWDGNRLVIVLGEKISFRSGRADLIYSIEEPLRRLAEIIKGEKGFKVAVSGHTDNTPIHTLKFPSNWELSVARAVNTARFLIGCGVKPSIISVEGFAQFKPVAPNNTPEKQEANRRVEISLVRETVKHN